MKCVLSVVLVLYFALVVMVTVVNADYGAFSYAPLRAVCHLQPDPNSAQKVKGTIILEQESNLQVLNITVTLSGLKHVAEGSPRCEFQHGFHVHTYGDLTTGCGSTGGHYNPFDDTHGAPSSVIRHVGDFGNIMQTPDGKINKNFSDPVASLFGSHTIVGRAIVLHAGSDDLGLGDDAGSRATGNAGSRLGCCVIGWAKQD